MEISRHPVEQLILPLARLCVAAGVKLPELMEQCKAALVQAALEAPIAPSDSTVSVMTGVHRKDVRRFREQPAASTTARTSLPAQVFSRWRSHPDYLTKAGKPRVLSRNLPDPAGRSFEQLVASISTDVHARSVLDELLRLEVVSLGEKDTVKLIANSFTPTQDRAQLWQLATQNAVDHLETMEQNLRGGTPQLLEQAIFSDGLTAQSAQEFNQKTAQAWQQVFTLMMPELQRLFEQDKHSKKPRTVRVSLGMYSNVKEEK
jgi:Family of unknown function (DUF6502)